MNKNSKFIQNMNGHRLGTGRLNIIWYTNDAVLIAESEFDLQKSVFKFNKSCILFNKKISTMKIKMMKFAEVYI